MGATELKDEATKEQRGDGVQPLRPEEVLDPNEVRKVLEKAEPGYYRTLFLTAYLTGMRSGELFALRWSDIELKGIDAETGKESSRGRIFVRRSLSWARVKKDDGPVRPRFFPPKTKAGVRTLPIPVELAGALRRWKLQCPQSEHDLVFPMRRRPADASQHGAALWLVAGAQPRRFAQGQHALAASLVCVGADHGGSTGDRGSEPAWTLQSGGHAEGLFALVQERRDGFGGQAGEESDDRLQKSWTLFGHFRGCSRRQIPHKYLISLSGEVAEWSKAPDC